MKGLLLKDILLLKKQTSTLLIFAFVIAVNAALAKEEVNSFAFFLGTFFLASLATTSIIYDQQNDGYQFLFTLPASKLTYVIEKSLLILLFSLAGILFGLIVSFAAALFFAEAVELDPEFLVMMTVTSLAGGCLYGSLMTPLYIKFGVEKARYVMFAVMVVIVGVPILISQTGIIKLDGLVSLLNNTPLATIVLVVLVAVVLVMGFSTYLSWRFLEKRTD